MTARQDEDDERKKLARGMQDADRAAKALKQALKDAADAAKEEAKAREKAIDGLKDTAKGIAAAGVSALGQRGAGGDDLAQGVYEGFSQALPDLLGGIGSLIAGKSGEAVGRAAGNLGRSAAMGGQTQQQFDARKLAIADTNAFTASRAAAGVPVTPEQSARIFAAFFAKEMRALENERQTRENAKIPTTPIVSGR